MVASSEKRRIMDAMPVARDIPADSPAEARMGAFPTLLGVDPGLQRTGYAVLTPTSGAIEARVIEAGVIKLDPRQPIEARLLELEDGLDQIIRTHGPTTMAVEQLYAHYKHPRTAIVMGHARGVILALAARRGLNVINIAATHVKKHLTGSGRASKVQIQRAVAATLNLPTIPEPNDVADAIAVALCGLHMQREAETGGRGSRRAATGRRPVPKCSLGPPRPTVSPVENRSHSQLADGGAP